MGRASLRVLGAAAAAALACASARAQDLTAAIDLKVALQTIDGRPIDRPGAATPFRIALTLADQTSRAPSTGLHLSAFLRPEGARPADCRELARIYRATRRTARGDIDLNGLVVASLGDDGRLAIADPRLDLASSNLTRIVAFAEPPAAVAADRATLSLVASLTDRGELVRIQAPSGDVSPFASGLDRPREVFAGSSGRMVVNETGAGRVRVIDRNGATVEMIETGPGARLEDGAGALLIRRADGLTIALDRASGAEIGRAPFDPDATAVAYSPLATALVAALPGRPALIRRFLDEPGGGAEIAIAAPAERVAASRDGRFLFALGEGGRALSIVEMSDETMVQAAVMDEPVIGLAATDGFMFLQFEGRSAVGVVSLETVRRGAAVAIRRVDLGRAAPGAQDGSVSIMTPLDGGGGVMVAGPDPRGIFFVMQEAGHANAPQTAVRLKSAAPRAVVALDRSFLESAPGRYETVAVAPHGGRWTFVASAGAGALVRCATFEVEGEGPARAAQAPRLVLDPDRSRIRVGAPSELVFRITGAEARPTRAVAAGLVRPWRATSPVRQAEEGSLSAAFMFPSAGLYPVVVDGADGEVVPMIVEVRE